MNSKELKAFLSEHVEDVCRDLLPAGKRVNGEWLVGNITGEAGKSLGVCLTGERAGLWRDRSADEHGGIMELIIQNRGCTYQEACDWARQRFSLPDFKPESSRNGAKPFDPLSFPHKTADSPERRGDQAWPYHNPDGQIIGYVVRFNNPDGSKDERPLRCVNGKWAWRGWRKPECPPIYNLHELLQRPDDDVLVVEGEKTCDAAKRMFRDYVCITWQGGSSAVSRVNWDALLEREGNIVLWPDNDPPGRKAMIHLLNRRPSGIFMVDLPDTLPKGWDLADDIPEDFDPEARIVAALNPVHRAAAPAPFDSLGIGGDATYVYFSKNTHSPIHLSRTGHKPPAFFSLAPLEWWEQNYPSRNGDGVNWNLAASDTMQICGRSRFDPDVIRSCGLWRDEGRLVYHLGDRLWVDGEIVSLSRFKSRFIYQSRPAIRRELCDPLPSTACSRFKSVFDHLPLRRTIQSVALGGWIMVAPICGILGWRPHLQICGEPDSGKTWSLNNLFDPLLDKICIRTTGNSTEAGIRQTIQSAAVPVVIDETEVDSRDGMSRMNKIQNIARIASAEGGVVLRGTASGEHALEYQVRCMFAFASVLPVASLKADTSRFATAEFWKRPDQEPFKAIMEVIRITVSNHTWCNRFLSRALNLAETIVHNTAVFQEVVWNIVGDNRISHQFGALFAGWHAYASDSKITIEEARGVVGQYKFDSVAEMAGTDDQSDVLDRILTTRIHWNGTGRLEMAQISTLISTFWNNVNSEDATEAEYALKNYGIIPQTDGILVMRTDRNICSIFTGTAWADKRWTQQLKRLDGVEDGARARNGAAKTCRTLFVSRESIRTHLP